MSSPLLEYLRPSLLDALPPTGHAILEASAGTGKTYVIEHLIIELLSTAANSIEEILVVTFTDKATAELRARIRDAIQAILRGRPGGTQAATPGHQPATVGEAARLRLEHALANFGRAPIFTIHAFCNRVLTEFAFHSGARFNLDLVDGRRAFRTTFRAMLRERFAVDPLMRPVLAEWLQSKDTDQLENLLFEAHRSRYPGINHSDAIDQVQRALAAKEPIGERLRTDLYLPPLEERFDRDKRQRGQLDYDDMLALVWRALEAPGGAALTALLRNRFRFGLVDEFQDTDDLQWQIFRRIFVESGEGNRLFVVADPKQAIYAFRGADVYSYQRARKELLDATGSKIQIAHNFRSTADLIDAYNLILDQKAERSVFTGDIKYDNPVECGLPDRVARDAHGSAIVPITLMSYTPAGGEKGSTGDARQQLGRFIAATIKRMIAEPRDAVAPNTILHGITHGITIDEPDRKSGTAAQRRVGPSDIFVLTYTNNNSREIGNYLREAGVPFAFYKLDELFQTAEATDVLDVLRAIEDLNDRSHLRRAWMSPFFALKYREVATIDDPPPSHPLNQLLFQSRALADGEHFAELFNRLMHESGLAARELFLDRSERELTNYSHIFEILLERAVAGRLSFSEIVELLADYINRHAEPPGGPNGNLQRLESERDAVQIMTVHMSKGLEADVVFLFGGTNANHQRPPVSIYHDGFARRFAIGPEARKEMKGTLDRERDEEHQRLLYVAMTRARAKLYLPLYPLESLKLDGPYKQLNARLLDLKEAKGAKHARRAKLIEIVNARDAIPITSTAQRGAIPIDQWTPPPELLIDKSAPEQVFDRLRHRHAPFRTDSYTSLKNDTAPWDLTPADFKTDLPPLIESDDLPGGSDVGIFLHEVIEQLDFASLVTPIDLDSWRRLDSVNDLFRASMERHQVRDPRWFDRGTAIVFRTLTSPIAITADRTIATLARCRNTREMEFLFPLPEAAHPALGSAITGSWIAERGYLKGFIDFVFEHDGLIYFADWKSDLLSAYDAATMSDHVTRNYELQARIYSVGVIRLLRIRSEAEYRRRFGGLLYVFLRGVGADADPSRGIYFQRPDWRDIRRYEAALMELR
jgi:exodeoxyribonuclease V beta subunit